MVTLKDFIYGLKSLNGHGTIYIVQSMYIVQSQQLQVNCKASSELVYFVDRLYLLYWFIIMIR